MSFFDDVGSAPEWPERPEFVVHPWFGPPQHVIAGSVPGSTVIFRNEKVALVFDHLGAFETGLLFTMNLWIREPDGGSSRMWEPPWEMHEGGVGYEDPEFLRLGMEFSNGSKWTNLSGPFVGFDEPPSGPIVHPQGGGGGQGSWSFEHWLWPLPPAGDMVVHASWPAQGIQETSVTINATTIVEAAERSVAVWPA